MKKYIFLFLIFPLTFYANWPLIIEKYVCLLNDQQTMILKEQYQAFVDQQLPSIVHKNIKSIPIYDCGESLIDIKEQLHDRIVMLADPIVPFASPDCNSGFDASSKVRASLYQKLVELVVMLDSIASNFGYQPGEVSIRVFEGLRDILTQKILFDNKFQEIASLYPELSEQEVFAETCKWVSPVIDNVPVHSTGAAVDIRLFNIKTKKFVDMGKFGVIWGNNPAAPTFFAGLTQEQIKNRLWLYIAALKIGLINYPYEFWHFSLNDRYATFWLKSDPFCARYGSI